MTERNRLVSLLLVSCQPSLNAYIFSFLFSFLQFAFVLLCFCFVLFCFFFLIFQADTSSILFHFVVENLILHIFLIIIIIMPCSGMFRNVPCSWFYRRPFKCLRSEIYFLTACLLKPSVALCPIPQNALTPWPRV